MVIRKWKNRLKWRRQQLRLRWHRFKVRWHRRERLLFPSPAEAQWALMMGAVVVQIRWIRRFWRSEKYRYPLCFIIPWGWYKDNYIEREIWVAGYQIDFGNRKQRLGIEIDGRRHDVVYDYERDQHLAAAGWRLQRFPAAWVHPHSPEYRGAWVVEQSGLWFS